MGLLFVIVHVCFIREHILRDVIFVLIILTGISIY